MNDVLLPSSSCLSPLPRRGEKQNASAIILAGGKSSRMGRPKALLPFDGEPLIVHLVRRLSPLFADIVVVAAPDQELPAVPATVVHDTVAYQGPVGGLYYGLQAARTERCFVTACDAPFLNLPLIAYLLEQITDCDVVVPFWQERLQPLHAVYRRWVVALLQEQLVRQELRPVALYTKVRTREVSPEEIRRFDPEGLSFRTMNTPEEYAAALALWRARRVVCTVELFGVARLKAKVASVPLTLPPGATLRDAFAALAEQIPDLVGSVVTADRQGLTAGYACNVNGTLFTCDPTTPLHSGDSVLILSNDAGG
ncbi:MAG: NTP transferase domain-containing protein [Candidatus Binatia bacterium]|nr:NTP transferase domain-containing protein [Candidatus Binatia bacterium]